MVPAALSATTPDPRGIVSTATCLSSTLTCRNFGRWPPPPSVDKYSRDVGTLLEQHRSETKVQTVDHTVCRRSTSHVRSWDLLRHLMASNCCFWGAPGCSEVVCFVFFDEKVVCCVFFCKFTSNHCDCRNPTSLQIGNTHEYIVRCQMCCLSRASGVIVVVSGPSEVSVVFRLVRSWLFRNSGSWLRLFVARFWLADVG